MPNWDNFQVQHILNPNVDGGYVAWSQTEWNNFLRNRIGGNFGSKPINSVIIATPDRILQDFQNLDNHVQHNTGPDFYWSNSRYPIYVMTLNRSAANDSSSRYVVRRLGEMYFLALIHHDPNRPVHFHAQGPDRFESGNFNVRFADYPSV